MITLLEFFHLKNNKRSLDKLISFEDPHQVGELLRRKQGVIFLTGHQANWEIPFLAATALFPGIAIGKPIKNKWLYKWILSIREMNGGKIVTPKRAIRKAIRALKEGKFLGIVGDQAFPTSTYSYPLFGTRAWTTSTPALLAYKTGCPIVVGTTKRVGNHYIVTASCPIWPDHQISLKEDVPKMMNRAMHHLERSIQANPEQWMWIHDRLKQQGIDHVKRIYRYGFILVILPLQFQLETLLLIQKIFPRSFITVYAPKDAKISIPNCEIYIYEKQSDLFQNDWHFQLVLDFYNSRGLRRHFRKLGAFKALHLSQKKEIIIETLVKPECLTTVSL